MSLAKLQPILRAQLSRTAGVMSVIVCWGSKRSRLVSGASRTVHGVVTLVLLALCVSVALAAPAGAAAASRVVRYHGLRLNVPEGWPVYDLARQPHVCVRFNRHAVYLGAPGAQPLCSTHAAGRTEAVLVEPLSAHPASAGSEILLTPRAAADRPGGSAGELVRDGLRVLATWNAHPGLILRLLGLRSLRALQRPSAPRPAPAAVRPAVRSTRTATPADPGAVYTGPGFDACSAPSASQMDDWLASPDRAVGVYIGGANMACSQANLTPSWVTTEAAEGWHLIPIYVGLQAPKNSCGCASFTASDAAGEGTAAAIDAVTQAQALGIGTGNPIYFDMEAYTHDSKDTDAVLSFLDAWTTQLHASGYKSGVYSSDASGITDLVAEYGTTYPEPDDIWPATWDEEESTTDSYIPAGDWASHQRINQYDGGQDETYGSTTLDVDDDYVDALTAAAGEADPPPPSLKVSPASDGSITLRASWNAVPSVAAWQILGGSDGSSLSAVSGPSASPTVVVDSAYPYFAVNALSATGQVIGTSAPVATPDHLALFGHNIFVATRGLAAVPVGCWQTGGCHARLSLKSALGRVTTGSEYVPPGGGLVYFSLSAAAHARLERSRRGLLAGVTLTDRSGMHALQWLTLTPFTTSGSSPARSNSPAPSVSVVGLTDFVSNGWVGGVLTDCRSSVPCQVNLELTVGRTTIARTGTWSLGVGEFGYILFTLTRAGHSMLAHAAGNQLGARVLVTNGTDRASARVVLVAFG